MTKSNIVIFFVARLTVGPYIFKAKQNIIYEKTNDTKDNGFIVSHMWFD